MNVASVSSAFNTASLSALQRTPEATETQKTGGDKDGDKDDGSTVSAASAPAPSVNLNGQKTGQVINVAA